MKQTLKHRRYIYSRLRKLYEKHDKFMKKFRIKRSKLLCVLNERKEAA